MCCRGEGEMLETQVKLSIKRGLLRLFGLGRYHGPVIDPEGLVWDCKPAINPESCEIEEDAVSWVGEKIKKQKVKSVSS